MPKLMSYFDNEEIDLLLEDFDKQNLIMIKKFVYHTLAPTVNIELDECFKYIIGHQIKKIKMRGRTRKTKTQILYNKIVKII
jgi:hypothetical protein